MLSIDATGQTCGVVTFDLEPGGLSACDLAMPPGWLVLAASVGGSPAAISSQIENTWRITLGTPLPRRIEVIFTGTIGGVGEELSLTAPKLVGVPVSDVIWTITTPATWTLDPIRGTARGDQLQLQLQRLRHRTQLLSAGTVAREGIEPEDLSRWFKTWDQYVAEVLSTTEAMVERGSMPAGRDVQEVLQRVRQQRSRAAERIWALQSSAKENGTAGSTEETRDAGAAGEDVFGQVGTGVSQKQGHARSASIWRAVLGDGRSVPCTSDVTSLHLIAKDPESPVYFIRRHKRDRASGELVPGLAILIALALVYWDVRRGSRVFSFFVRHPLLAVGLLGVMWWMVLPVGEIGLCVTILSVVIAIWPTSRSRTTSPSDVIRIDARES